jgi:hypothetical protein
MPIDSREAQPKIERKKQSYSLRIGLVRGMSRFFPCARRCSNVFGIVQLSVRSHQKLALAPDAASPPAEHASRLASAVANGSMTIRSPNVSSHCEFSLPSCAAESSFSRCLVTLASWRRHGGVAVNSGCSLHEPA